MSILVVDDEELVRSSVSDFLETLGYEVLVANNGLHALELAKASAGRIQAVISDIDMPALSGPEMWQQLRTIVPSTCGIIFMTGKGTSTQVNLPGELIMKPFSLRSLEEKLAKLTGSGPGPS